MVEYLPPEMVIAILRKVGDGRELAKCRAVCRSWKNIIDDESFRSGSQLYKGFIEAEFRYFPKNVKSSNLTWYETYKALYSWENLKTADVNLRLLPVQAVKQIKLLANRVIAVLINTEGKLDTGSKCTYTVNLIPTPRFLSKVRQYAYIKNHYGQAIVYYNVDTLTEIKRHTYEEEVQYFDENEHVVLLNYTTDELVTIEKSNGKRHIIGKMSQRSAMLQRIILIEKKVYFYSDDDCLIHLCELKDSHAGITAVTTPLKGSEIGAEHIYQFGHLDGKLTVLATGEFIRIYCEDNHELRQITQKQSHDIDTIHSFTRELSKYGFDWTSLPDFWNRPGARQRTSCVCLHGNMLLTGNLKHVDFYYNINPFDFNPNCANRFLPPARRLKIDYDQLFYSRKSFNHRQQIEIIESVDCHLVIVFHNEKVSIYEHMFHDDDRDKKCCKRKYETRNASICKRSKL